MDFHVLVRQYRRETGLSQEDLAGRLGVEVSTVSRWERGLSLPGAVTYSRVTSIMRPRAGIDWQFRQMIKTTPSLMQMFLPCTRVLAASVAFQRMQRMSESEVAGLYDVRDFPPELVAEHEKHGGVERVFKTAKVSVGRHPWLATAPTNRTGEDIMLRFVSQRIALDDGTPAIVSTSERIAPGERVPFQVEW
jgi:transcriptional regulator with XRE-family HTH domain